MIKTVGIVSLSAGTIGEDFVKHEVEIGTGRLEKYGLNVRFLPHALKGIDYVKAHPENRAVDLISAFQDPEIDMILCAIGGDDTYRLLPYLFVYNNFSWFCPIELARDGNLALVNLSADPRSRVFKKAGAVGSKKVTRLFTDLKIPESAREGILFAARKNEDKILWIPGAGHAEGFTSPLSRERFGQHGETKAEGILKITLKRRQDGN